jgi:hypothetical protein
MKKFAKHAKTGKVIAVVAVMHIFVETKRTSPNAKAKISAKKAKLRSKLKLIGPN